MDAWKAEMGRVREEKKKEDQRRESQKKDVQVLNKVGKLPNTVFLRWFAAPDCRKVGSLKRRAQSHMARWEMNKCTRLWHEAHFQVMCKTQHSRSTFGSWDAEQVHAVVAPSTCRSQNCWMFGCRSRDIGSTVPTVSKLWGFCCRFNNNHH